MYKINANIPFDIAFDLSSGLARGYAATRRSLSQIKTIFADAEAAEEMLRRGDPLVYEFYELDMPRNPGDLKFGTSIVYPGCVGSEYFMTKGHFHSKRNTAETYLCLKGRGCLVTEDARGRSNVLDLTPGSAVYVPRGHAHRSVNTSDEPLVTFFAFRADAGHDYGAIEKRGFGKIILRSENGPRITDNPRYRDMATDDCRKG